jgi:hypothetical protein
MKTLNRKASKREAWLGAGLLVLLVLIGLQVWRQQHQFNPAVRALRPEAQEAAGLSSAPANLLAKLPAGLNVMTPMERFGPDNLYEKIDGQAELYLSAGFVELRCQRLVAKDTPDLWLEAFVYDMGTDLNAFAVYSRQRRENARPVAGRRLAYQTENALFAVHGALYIEIIAAASSERADQMLQAVAAGLIQTGAAAETPSMGLEWFPPDGRDPESLTVMPDDAFGFAELDRVVTVTYTLNGSEMTAFVSRRPTDQAARVLADAYGAFLVTYGGTVRAPEASLPSGQVIEIMDTFDIVFTVGPFVAGVHEAPDRSSAAELALRLNQTLKGIVGDG